MQAKSLALRTPARLAWKSDTGNTSDCDNSRAANSE